MWHILMLNSWWGQDDNCIQQSWYLANDIWFMIVLLVQIEYFMKSRRFYFLVGIGLSGIALLIQIYSIFSNDFSASYLTYNDSYWTHYYIKPYTHFHSYNLGIFLGCAYFSWKFEMNKGRSTQTKKSKLEGLYTIIKYQNATALLCMILGLIIMFMVLSFNKLINLNPDGVAFFWSFVYLLISRPCYTIGFALFIMPIILENPIFNSVK